LAHFQTAKPKQKKKKKKNFFGKNGGNKIHTPPPFKNKTPILHPLPIYKKQKPNKKKKKKKRFALKGWQILPSPTPVLKLSRMRA
jgi:hypothetical protein